jgi:hypothetical protein
MPFIDHPDSFSTEKPLDFDYFHKKENMDTKTIAGYLREYNKIGGLYVHWYKLQDATMGMDPVFLEKADKKWSRPVRIKAVFQYLEEVIENQKYGIQVLDEVNLIIEKVYWKDTTKVERPLIGDLFFIEHVGLMFEVVNVVDSEANFFGNKLTWKITAKIYQLGNEDQTVIQDIVEPGWAPDEQMQPQIPIPGEPNPGTENPLTGEVNSSNPTAGIEEKCEELYQYDATSNPFGNY